MPFDFSFMHKIGDPHTVADDLVESFRREADGWPDYEANLFDERASILEEHLTADFAVARVPAYASAFDPTGLEGLDEETLQAVARTFIEKRLKDDVAAEVAARRAAVIEAAKTATECAVRALPTAVELLPSASHPGAVLHVLIGGHLDGTDTDAAEGITVTVRVAERP